MPDENAKSSMPVRKVMVGGLAGALSILLVWCANTFLLPETKPIPSEIAQALTVIFSFIVSYFVPAASSE